MTTFEDGPAKGQTLMLHRAPVFLRVTQDQDGWDALDQLEDSPRKNEAIFVYRRVGEPSMVHINRGRKPGSGFYTMATYKFVEKQPSDHEMRDTVAWRKWCSIVHDSDRGSQFCPQCGGEEAHKANCIDA